MNGPWSDEQTNRQLEQALEQLRLPFHPEHVTWKPGVVAKSGDRALALAYADVRAYQNRLDEVCGGAWAVSYTPWGERIICNLTLFGVTRSSTGEPDADSDRNEIGGTVAEAQAFKRACSMFGLGRYLYTLPSVWADYDKESRQFTEPAKAKLLGILMQQYRKATSAVVDQGTEGDPSTTADLRTQVDTLGGQIYGDQWPEVCTRNVKRITAGQAELLGDLTAEQLQKLIAGLQKLQKQRETA